MFNEVYIHIFPENMLYVNVDSACPFVEDTVSKRGDGAHRDFGPGGMTLEYFEGFGPFIQTCVLALVYQIVCSHLDYNLFNILWDVLEAFFDFLESVGLELCYIVIFKQLLGP
jgi:hypothetical protein